MTRSCYACGAMSAKTDRSGPGVWSTSSGAKAYRCRHSRSSSSTYEHEQDRSPYGRTIRVRGTGIRRDERSAANDTRGEQCRGHGWRRRTWKPAVCPGVRHSGTCTFTCHRTSAVTWPIRAGLHGQRARSSRQPCKAIARAPRAHRKQEVKNELNRRKQSPRHCTIQIVGER
jgi:hypothetical protein